MRVCLVVGDYPPNIIGGEAYSAEKMVEMLPKYGVELEVVAPGMPSKKVEEGYGVKVHRARMSGPNFITRSPSFTLNAKKIIGSLDYDLLHTSNRLMDVATRKPVIVHFRSTHYESYKLLKNQGRMISAYAHRVFYPFDRRMAAKSRRIFVLSEHMRRQAKQWIENEKIAVVPNGVDTNLFKPFNRRFGSGRILYVGRFDKFKNIETLIDAFKKLPEGYSLDLVGYGPLEMRLRKMSEGFNINFLGKIRQQCLPEVYNNCDLLVMPSSYEPFGKVALESMACGTPTIVSEEVVDFGCPRFNTYNPDDLAKKMLDILEDEQVLVRMSKKMREKSLDYSWGRVCKRIVENYVQVINTV